ncbi:MAG: phosphonate ABC transporter, permease protein PhnE [Erysipelotrichaceae bacterium]|nr:phosphonate ABC transporter, permease protein PhnE [Erysipelotrichaceae bacterium]
MSDNRLKQLMPARRKKPSLEIVIITFIFIALFVLGVMGAEITLARIFKGFDNIGNFLMRAFPPDFSKVNSVVKSVFETLQMAVVGTVFGVILSLPIALLGAKNTAPSKILANISRGIVIVSRTIPDLVFALIFVITVGLGSFAGILTIMIDTVGFCGRFFMERIEELDPGPIQALESTGASRFGVTAGAIMPMTFPSFVGTSLFALEKSIRGASVLGLVGAGGIGIELNTAMNLRRYDSALMIILVILIVVLIFEKVSRSLRERIM